MCDIDKILRNFENDLNSKKPEEKVAYLRSFGFKVKDKQKNKNLNQKKQNGRKPILVNP